MLETILFILWLILLGIILSVLLFFFCSFLIRKGKKIWFRLHEKMKNQSMKQKLKKKKDLTTTDEYKEEIDLVYQNVIAEIQKDGESLIENSSQSVENHAETEKTVEESAS